ncbi:hypothetical protein BKP64_12650 [Marinobacter salinus]|uniref:Uncharacterized protein n=1 Tax=Marinobacter salinus TaxID=1874317 RepID=A0A1D9GRY0_9GAMM|nr:hypothetical protein BKP64_12650 [Marinobacter salinus]
MSSATERASPADVVALGVERFQSGDLEEARKVFEAARAGGIETVSLNYNLGVVYYRLGQYSAAEASFRKLLSTDHRILASYNLGLVALATGNRASARDWFLEVSAPASPEKLRRLALIQLETLSAEPGSRWPAAGIGYLALSAGYDSNIAGLPESVTSSQGGAFVDALAAGSIDLSVLEGGRLALEGAAYARQYPSKNSYNTELMEGKLAWSRNLDASSIGGALTLSQSWFDSDEFERRFGIEGGRRWQTCPGQFMFTDCSLSLAFAQVTGGSEFESYDGQFYRLGLSAVRRSGDWRLRGQYSWEVNDRRDLQAGDQFVSVSPEHHKVELTGSYDLRPAVTAGWIGSFRYSRYRDSHVLLVDGALVTERRTDKRVEAGLFLESRLDERWLLRVEWTVLDNVSGISRYSYRRHMLMGTLEGVF